MCTGNTEAPENKWGSSLAALGNLLATLFKVLINTGVLDKVNDML